MLKIFSRLERKQLLYIGVFLIVLLLVWVFLAPRNSALHLFRVQKELKMIQTKNKALEEENAALRAEIDKLENDPAYLEEKARKDYGLIKKNELLYKFDKQK
jgi:cell division protein FtsB